MSVTDPHIKSLKLCLLQFLESNIKQIDDYNPELLILSKTLENIFNFGLKEVPSFFASTKCNFWSWVDKLDKLGGEFNQNLEYGIKIAIHKARTSRKVVTDPGRGRLFLRDLVQHKKLHNLIQFLAQNRSFLLRFYEDDFSILTDEILMQILHSLVCELGRLDFNLNLLNADFLDDTWEMPTLLRHEFIPCRSLGLTVQYLCGHFVITNINEASVVLDDGLIERGDVITALHDSPLRGVFVDLKKIITSHGNSPIPMVVSKIRLLNGHLFKPIVHILRKNGFSTLVESLERSIEKCIPTGWPSSESLDSWNGELKFTNFAEHHEEIYSYTSPNTSIQRPYSSKPLNHKLRYIGQCFGGSDGSIDFIYSSIPKVVAENPNPKKYLPVLLTTGELCLTIRLIDKIPNEASTTDVPFLQHSFPQISAVGRTKDRLRYVGYTASDITCNLASSFTCYVFLCMNENVALEFISLISSGFRRTHWAM